MTKWLALFFALITVFLQTFSQMVIKQRVVTLSPNGLGLDGVEKYLLSLLSDAWVLIGIAAAFFGMLAYLLALSKLPLSQAYPFVALTIPFVAIVGAIYFGESISILRGVGLTAIVAGCLCIAISN